MHNKVKELLLGDKPCAIGKIGSIELMYFYAWLFDKKVIENSLSVNAGINCRDQKEYDDWADDFKYALENLDILLTWNNNLAEESITNCLFKGEKVKNFPDIEPFFHGKDGWHYGLKDKKVLVVSSFKDSIDAQIPNFSKIWKGAELGSCKVIKCPQPHQVTGGPIVFYRDAMYRLADQICDSDFDVCIVGCGGYSLALCNLVKQIGKKAIHLGGATQVLFGICGSRFDRNFADQEWYGTDAFIRSLESDIPKNYQIVEQGCYW